MYCAGYPSSLPTQLNWCNEGQRQTEETVTCFQQDKLNEKASLEAKTNHHENMVFYTHHLLPTTWYDSLTCSGVYLKSTARVHPLGSLQRKHWKFGSEKYQSDLTRISFPPYNNILTIYKRMLDMTCWRNSEKLRGQDWQWIEIEVGDLNRPWKARIIFTGFRQRGSAVPEVSSMKVIWQDLFAIGKLTVVGG